MLFTVAPVAATAVGVLLHRVAQYAVSPTASSRRAEEELDSSGLTTTFWWRPRSQPYFDNVAIYSALLLAAVGCAGPVSHV